MSFCELFEGTENKRWIAEGLALLHGRAPAQKVSMALLPSVF